ncbi:uncharacterized protein STEHIDRAFT_112247 [Stereum hirsutum FP-91666 SS1]|uniref:uncharacterized protein n=1 Tax=Stereum hirsutum (strain FP-91666) TaxID=721885 RepID=UPI000444966C|nr:uncharacterized protein STEHIDRAFT_112247 [Stereum hirsutum FP-91666 SS1]EIM84657.1 hypothetical protein STEHIDRAFT_112247 [Stereum hirsutum FP-91666 SS1]
MASKWNFTIDDNSLLFNYTPYSDGFNISDGWKTWYTGSGYIDSQSHRLGDTPQGHSYHQTRLNGASVTLRFYGSGIYLFGNTTSPYTVTLDNRVVLDSGINQNKTLLFADGELGVDNTHYITLTANISDTSQILALDRALVESTLNNGAKSPTSTAYDSLNTTFFRYSSGWQTTSVSNIPSAATPAPFESTVNPNSTFSFSISNATSVAVNASLNIGHGPYQVTIDNDASLVFNGSMNWLVGNEVIFYQGGLDLASNHTLNFTNIGLQGQNHLTLNSVTLYNSRSQTDQPAISSGKNLSTGAKAGIGVSVAVTVIALALAAAFFLLLRRRQRGSSGPVPKSSSDLEVDPFTEVNAQSSCEDIEPNATGNRGKRHGQGVVTTIDEVEGVGTSTSQIVSTPIFLTSTTHDKHYQPISTATQSSMSSLGSPGPSTAITEVDPVHSPPDGSLPSSSQEPQLQHQDVERIVELVAHRIDPASRMESHEAPPEYQSQAGWEA